MSRRMTTKKQIQGMIDEAIKEIKGLRFYNHNFSFKNESTVGELKSTFRWSSSPVLDINTKITLKDLSKMYIGKIITNGLISMNVVQQSAGGTVKQGTVTEFQLVGVEGQGYVISGKFHNNATDEDVSFSTIITDSDRIDDIITPANIGD